LEGRASRSITERESRGRDEDGRGHRIGAEKERRGRDVVVSRLGFVRTFTGRGRGRPTIRVDMACCGPAESKPSALCHQQHPAQPLPPHYPNL